MSEEMAGKLMATDSDAATSYTVFINTPLGTNFATNVSDSYTVSDFKKKVLVEHTQCFPEIGDVKINSLKVKRGGCFYHLAESMIVKSAFHGLNKNWCITVDICKVEPCDGVANGIGSSVPLNGIGKMLLDGQAEGLVNGVDLSLEVPKVDQCVEQKTPILDDNVEGEANVSREGVADRGVAKKKRKRSKNDLPSESSEETFKAAAIGEDNEDYLPLGHLGSGKKTKKKKTSHPLDQEIAAVQSSGTGARCEHSVVPVGTSSNSSGEETAAATVQDVNEKLLSQDVDMNNTNPVNVQSQHDFSKPAAAPDAKEMKDSRITENETDVVARLEFFEVGETVYPKKSSKKRKKSKRTRDTLSRQPLTSDAEQVEGPVPVTSSTEPHQAVNRDQANQDNPEKKAMEKGDDASETAMVNGFRFSTSEHLEVADTVSPKKASNKRRKSKRSSHSALLDAEQVEGSVPVISSTEPQQSNNGNDPFKYNWEERTMKEGEDNDLRIANFELHEVVEPENLEKSSKRRKSKKPSRQLPTSDAAQVEGSLPVISSTEPHQTVNGNHSDQDKWEKGTMKGGQGASETAMVGDLRLATDKEIKPLLDAEQVEGSVPVISSTEPQQANNGNDPFKDNGEERTMKEGEDNDLRIANFELHEVVEPENLKKSSKRRKSKKTSRQPPTSDAAQVEGSPPVISSTEPHQTVNGNHSDQDKWGKGTMKGGQGASETAMVGDLRLATDKEIKPLLDAEQVEGSVPVISSTEPQQANNGNDPFKDNGEERTMKEGEGNDLRAANFELHEVVEPENLEKLSKKRKKSKKTSRQPPTSDAAQVEGSPPVISATEPHQTVNGNHSDQDKWEKGTMKGGQGASETAMVGDLHLATDKEINDIIANVVDSVQMKTTHSDTGFANNPPTGLDSITLKLSHVPAHKLDGSSEGRRLEAVVNSPSKNAHADKPRNDVEVSDESQEINFNQYFVPSNQHHEKGTSSELVEKAPNAKGVGSETKSEKKRNMKFQTKGVHGHQEYNRLNGRKPPLTNTGVDVEARASTKSSLGNSGSMNFHNKLAHGHQEHSRVDGKKPSSTNTGVVVSGPARGRSLIGKSGTIFDDDKLGNSPNEDGPDDSDASTRTPSDYSLSSDYTDGESSSVLNTSQNGSDGSRRKGTDRKNIPNLLSSGMSLDRILKSSSRFKKAKLAASQSELEDTESQPVDFVPDSLAHP